MMVVTVSQATRSAAATVVRSDRWVHHATSCSKAMVWRARGLAHGMSSVTTRPHDLQESRPDLSSKDGLHAEAVEVSPPACRPAVGCPCSPAAGASQQGSGVANVEDDGAGFNGHLGDGERGKAEHLVE